MKVIIATGGTGGHIFPALSLGQALSARGHDVTFIGSGRPLDLQVAATSSIPWKQLPVGRVKRVGWKQQCLSLASLPYAFFRALWIIIQIKPKLIIGVGGASTGPLVLMGRLLGRKTAILEQNRIPGFANRLLAPFAHRIFLGLPLVSKHWCFKKKVRITGNPIRQEVLQQFSTTEKSSDRFTLLVFGGSQGAQFLNDLTLQLLPRLSSANGSLRIIHITGQTEYERVRAAYQNYPEIDATVLPFSDTMGHFYKEADLVFARAGAGTISDLMTLGRPALLVPYPYAADNHQEANAKYLSDTGAALTKKQEELTPEIFWRLIQDWIRDRTLLMKMAQRAQALAPSRPEERIIDECERLVTSHV